MVQTRTLELLAKFCGTYTALYLLMTRCGDGLGRAGVSERTNHVTKFGHHIFNSVNPFGIIFHQLVNLPL